MKRLTFNLVALAVGLLTLAGSVASAAAASQTMGPGAGRRFVPGAWFSIADVGEERRR